MVYQSILVSLFQVAWVEVQMTSGDKSLWEREKSKIQETEVEVKCPVFLISWNNDFLLKMYSSSEDIGITIFILILGAWVILSLSQLLSHQQLNTYPLGKGPKISSLKKCNSPTEDSPCV